ncbi:MAG: thioredoxin [Natrialbaceae archaeon]|nr:thioredoxin [Natrialbaceae archaeon]
MATQSPPDTGSTPKSPVTVTSQADLESTVEEYDVVVVDFYADWCGPCRMMEPDLESLAAETDAVVAKVNVDDNQRLASAFGVRGVPTLVFYSNGEAVHKEVGMVPGTQLRTLVDSYS